MIEFSEVQGEFVIMNINGKVVKRVCVIYF